MVTPEVINYIKTQLQNGQTIDNIKASLIERGWKENDANSAIQAATSNNNNNITQSQNVPTSLRSNKFLIIGLLLIVLLTIFGAGGYLLVAKKANNQPKQAPAIPTIIIQKSPSPTKTASAIDCGTENIDQGSAPKSPLSKLECFINATKNCDLARLTVNGSLDLGGITTSTVYFETKGMQNGKCELYTKQGEINHVFPIEVPQDQQKPILDAMRKSVGMDGTCLFARTSDLTTMFTNWEKGNFSTGNVSCKLSPNGDVCTTEGGDFAAGECRGPYFEYRANAGQTNP